MRPVDPAVPRIAPDRAASTAAATSRTYSSGESAAAGDFVTLTPTSNVAALPLATDTISVRTVREPDGSRNVAEGDEDSDDRMRQSTEATAVTLSTAYCTPYMKSDGFAVVTPPSIQPLQLSVKEVSSAKRSGKTPL
jgi:hypothetical protein